MSCHTGTWYAGCYVVLACVCLCVDTFLLSAVALEQYITETWHFNHISVVDEVLLSDFTIYMLKCSLLCTCAYKWLLQKRVIYTHNIKPFCIFCVVFKSNLLWTFGSWVGHVCLSLWFCYLRQILYIAVNDFLYMFFVQSESRQKAQSGQSGGPLPGPTRPGTSCLWAHQHPAAITHDPQPQDGLHGGTRLWS